MVGVFCVCVWWGVRVAKIEPKLSLSLDSLPWEREAEAVIIDSARHFNNLRSSGEGWWPLVISPSILLHTRDVAFANVKDE